MIGARRRGVPVVRQMAAADCGAACLAMVLGYFGKPTRLSTCAARVGADARGVTALGIAEAARGFGLRVRAYQLDASSVARASLPAVVHWRGNHFVVVEQCTSAGVTVVDPALGRRRLTAAEFAAAFAGLTLTFEPGDGFQPGAGESGPSAWRRSVEAFLAIPGARGLLAEVWIASMLLLAFGLVSPVFTGLIVDRIIPLAMLDAMTLIGLGLAALAVGHVATGYVRARLLLRLQRRLDAHVMRRFVSHLLSLPFAFFQQRSTGDLLARLASNTVLRETLTAQSVAVALDGALVAVYLVVLLLWSPLFAAIIAAVGLIEVGLLVLVSGRLQALSQQELAAQAREQSYLVEALTGIGMVKAGGAEERTLASWEDLFRTHLSLAVARGHTNALVDAALTAIKIGVPLILLWLGVYQVIEGRLNTGTMLQLTLIAAACLVPLTGLSASFGAFQVAAAHAERIGNVLDAEPERAGGAELVALHGRVVVDGVNFRYGGGERLVLRSISFTVEPGQTLAIVGPSGSGKSTLVGVLLGLLTPAAGIVRYDGVALEALDMIALRRQIGSVLQGPALFAGTVADNLRLAAPGASADDLAEAARLAQVHDDVRGLPMGYETWIGEGGSALSGGQRQRLALARALLMRPRVLLLDEATSHVDQETEQRIMRNLDGLHATRIVVAHRASTVRGADWIVVLRDGAVAEAGTPEGLIARGGYFAEMVDRDQRHSSTEGSSSGLPRESRRSV